MFIFRGESMVKMFSSAKTLLVAFHDSMTAQIRPPDKSPKTIQNYYRSWFVYMGHPGSFVTHGSSTTQFSAGGGGGRDYCVTVVWQDFIQNGVAGWSSIWIDDK